MAKFGDPEHHGNMMAGCEAALKSTKTPAHLKAHLQKRLDGGMMAKPDSKAPVGQGGRFAALAKKTSPALAAFIGRKKYGKAKFQAMAAKGKKSAKKDYLYGE